MSSYLKMFTFQYIHTIQKHSYNIKWKSLLKNIHHLECKGQRQSVMFTEQNSKHVHYIRSPGSKYKTQASHEITKSI